MRVNRARTLRIRRRKRSWIQCSPARREAEEAGEGRREATEDGAK